MDIARTQARSILTPQPKGFLASPPYPFTHTLSAYTGCGFGKTTCGLYCYAQWMPNWRFAFGGTEWGTAVQVKENAATLLDDALRRMTPARRRALRIFMSSITDPYQPLEHTAGITHACLEVFRRYDDLDLLVIQTRSLLVARDFDLIGDIPYAWLSMTVESDDQVVLERMRGGPPFARRLKVARDAVERGIKTQIAVSPCLPYTEQFVERLQATGAQRVIVDTCVDGDGSGGQRTARSAFPAWDSTWKDTRPAHALFDALRSADVDVGWSAEGFCGIAPRYL